MKHLKRFNESTDADTLISLRELLLELTDGGFRVDVWESNSTRVIDFQESGLVNASHLISTPNTRLVKTIDVAILKPGGRFLIDDILENLLFVESYAKNELGLDLLHIHVCKELPNNDSWRQLTYNMYYKSIELLPFDSNWWAHSITVSFKKEDQL
jgi:hypothetical protein